jgi:hypothetical protein
MEIFLDDPERVGFLTLVSVLTRLFGPAKAAEGARRVTRYRCTVRYLAPFLREHYRLFRLGLAGGAPECSSLCLQTPNNYALAVEIGLCTCTR